ncbi:MAG: FtsW/RodA/SpoVE family cell cycle protein [Coriobacteriales bacterium]|jgi:peptidoglycan glycosyltransferase|nr:FtsW/RodA/SpoVE family cell cycle protein [Coriobacteriales bacterium]
MSATATGSVSTGHKSGLTRRSLELLLLCAASPIIILIFILALLSDGQPFQLTDLAIPLGLFAAFLASHLAVRKLAPGADAAILPLCFMLSGIGIAFVMRLAPNLAGRQVIWLFVSIAAMVLTLVFVRSVRKLGDFKYTILILGLLCLALPAVIGTEQNGSKIWLTFAGFSFQPGEVAKVLIILFLAGYLADNREMLSVSGRRLGRVNIPDLRTLVPLIIMWGISLLMVVFERDLGSALLFFGLFVLMLYVATGRVSFVVAAALLGIVGAVGAYFLFDHVSTRVSIWLDPFAYAQTSGYQLVQAAYSLADGDLLGTGIGRGMPTFIPIVESDFIFVAIAEEMGLLGAAGLLLLFILFAVRGFTIASRARSDMEAFSACGLTAAISLQAFVIVGGTTMLIPLTGVTLPFISQGGSSLLASFVILGLLLRISDSGTGLEKELVATVNLDGGVLGRVALGKRLTVLVTVFSLLFAILIGNLTYHMIFKAAEIRALPVNSHALAREARTQRGAIVSYDGVVLAQSNRNDDGSYTRVYPQGSLAAHIVGYSSARYGSAGVEATKQEDLRGETSFSSWSDAINALAGIPNPGNDIKLTLDSRIQSSAQDALGGYNGAAVALDARTGELLACASAPTYDLNDIDAILDANTTATDESVLLNRATSGLYAPGSTFKMVTLTGALYSAGMHLDDSFDAPGSMEIGGAQITNFGRESYGTISLRRAFELSSNTVFGQVADRMGASTLVATADSFGFGRTLAQDFDTTASLMPDPAVMSKWETAWAGAGEPVGEHANSPAGPQVTVTQMALVAAAFANNGTIMSPYVVDSVVAANGAVLSTTTPTVLGSVASPAVISDVNTAMEGVVNAGTGYAAQIRGYTVRGKTGTAETGRPKDDSWFVGYVDVGGRSVVVAIVLEEADSGTAVPAARSILQTAVSAYG